MGFLRKAFSTLKQSRSKSLGKGHGLNVVVLLMDGTRSDIYPLFKKFNSIIKQGTLFPNTITYAPYTVSATHAFITGMYGNENGVDCYYGSKDFKGEECKTLQEYFHDIGYYTISDTVSKLILPRQGFDEFEIHDENNEDLLRRHAKILKRITKLNKEGKSAFVFLQYSGVHAKWVEAVIKKFDDFSKQFFENKEKYRALYKSYFSNAEKYLDGIFSELRENSLLGNTILVVFSDHGTSNADRVGERAYGVYCYDYTLKTFVSFINKDLFPPKKIGLQVRSIDVMPTLLELLGIEPDEGFKKMQGKSLFPVIEGTETAERPSFSEAAGLGGPWPSPSKPNVHAVRCNGWKLIFNASPKTFELYDLEKDPLEEKNVESQFPEKKQELLNLMLKSKPELKDAFGQSL